MTVKLVATFLVALILGGAGGYLLGDRGGKAPAQRVVAVEDPSQPWLQVDGKTLAAQDVPADVRNEVYERRAEAFEGIEQTLALYGARVALAGGRTGETGEPPQIEELVQVPAPTEQEMRQLFEASKEQLPPGMDFDQVKDQIQAYLTQQRRVEAVQERIAGLRSEGRLAVLLPRPETPALEVDLAGFPARGPDDARVTLVEISDYLCPHCQAMKPEVERILQRHGSNVRYVHVDLALRPEQLSGQLARAAYCAQQQSAEAYWRFHDAAFETASSQSLTLQADADQAKVAEIAQKAALDAAALETCLASEAAEQHVAAVGDRMDEIGVRSTPTFLVNGRRAPTEPAGLEAAIADALSGDAAGTSH